MAYLTQMHLSLAAKMQPLKRNLSSRNAYKAIAWIKISDANLKLI